MKSELGKKMPMRGNWSDLPSDLMLLVFERLSLIDFCRAKAVCLAWYSASRLCAFKKESFPWLVLFPEKPEDYNCLLFNPEEDKVHGVRDLGNDFDKSSCMASHGSWFLFLDLGAYFYIMNPLTCEKIHLPPIECFDGQIEIEKLVNKFLLTQSPFCSRRIAAENLGGCFGNAALWIDERTRDYLAILVVESRNIVFCRKGDDRWKEVPNPTPKSHEKRVLYRDVVYKNGKLYVKGVNSFSTPHIKIWDFGGDFPVEIAEIQIKGGDYALADMAITLSGDILLVARPFPWSRLEPATLIDILTFKLNPVILMFKFNPEKVEWESIDTLGDEALNLDQRITVPTKGVKGIKGDLIYFNYENYWLALFDEEEVDTKRKIGVFNFGTRVVKFFKHLPQGRFRDAHWFFPGIGRMV